MSNGTTKQVQVANFTTPDGVAHKGELEIADGRMYLTAARGLLQAGNQIGNLVCTAAVNAPAPDKARYTLCPEAEARAALRTPPRRSAPARRREQIPAYGRQTRRNQCVQCGTTRYQTCGGLCPECDGA